MQKKSNQTEIIYHQPGHLKGVTVIQEIDEQIFTGGEDGRICIWSKNLDVEISCIYAHNASITDIQKIADTDYIITASQDLELKIWSLKTLALEYSKRAHSSTIIGAKPWKEYIFSAGRDQFIKKWKLDKDGLIEIEKIKIPNLERFFIVDDIIITSHHDGLISIYNALDLSFVRYLLIKSSTINKAIKKASKHIVEFQKEDSRVILHRFGRLNGVPAIVCKSTKNHIFLGHIAGMITVWDKENLKNTELIFTHGKNITGLDILDNIIISTSMSSSIRKNDLSTKQLITEYKLEGRPLVIYTSSENKIIIGLENGEIQIFDESLNFVKKREKIVPVSDLCIMPNNIAVASRDGEIALLDLKSLKLLNRVKQYKKSIQGIFYFNDRLITIGDNSTICFLDGELNELKRIEMKEKPTKLHQVKKYITLTPNLVLDLQNDKVIKGEVSKETKDEIEETSLFQIDFSHGDSSIFINHDRIVKDTNATTDSNYPIEIVRSINNLLESLDNMQYKKVNPYSVLKTKKK